jgi:hypothetical protein
MSGRLTGSGSWWRVSARLERPEVALLALVQAALVGYGWYATTFWLAVALGAQLVVAGLGAVWIIGPATARLGFARYAVPAVAGVALTLFGRAIAGDYGLLVIPVVVVVLWAILRLELELQATFRGRLPLELLLVAIVFAAADGTAELVRYGSWTQGLGLLVLIAAVPAMRMSEARGRYGVNAVGEGILQLLAVSQVAAGVYLLHVPLLVGAALVALTFHAWSGAAEALEGGATVRSVAVEFGALAVLGLVVALLLQGR